jgi:hypothetical protein
MQTPQPLALFSAYCLLPGAYYFTMGHPLTQMVLTNCSSSEA